MVVFFRNFHALWRFSCFLESNRLNLAPRTSPFALGGPGNDVKSKIHRLPCFLFCFVLLLFFWVGGFFFKSPEMTREVYRSFQLTAVSQTGIFLKKFSSHFLLKVQRIARRLELQTWENQLLLQKAFGRLLKITRSMRTTWHKCILLLPLMAFISLLSCASLTRKSSTEI